MVDIPAPAKRPLPFKRTAARPKADAKPKPETIELDDSSDSDGGLGLFRRAKTFFPKALAQQEALRKRKTSNDDIEPPSTPKNKGKQKETWRPPKESPDAAREPKSPPVKRQSDDSDNADSLKTPPSKRSRHSLSSASHSGGRRDRKYSQNDASPTRTALNSIPLRSPTKVKHKSFEGNPVISLDDSSEEEKPRARNDDIYEATPIRKFRDSAPPKPAVTDIPSSPDPFVSDKDDEADEFAEYVQAARERQQKAKEAITQSQASKPTALRVVVTTEIPGAHERTLKCDLTLRISKIKQAWCSAQKVREFTSDEFDGIFLTFRGRRLYDSTTIASLGVRITATGELALASAQSWSDREGILDSLGAIQIEAWTDETWELAQKEKERARLRDLGELSDDSQEDDLDDEPAPEPEEETIKVILKTRDNDKEAVKARARPMTTIAELIVYFRKARDLPETTPVVLQFDGEQLDEATTLQDAEIEDMDTIEVHIKG